MQLRCTNLLGFFIVGEKIYSYDVQIFGVYFIVEEEIYRYDLHICCCVFDSRRNDIQLRCTNLLGFFIVGEKIYSYDVQIFGMFLQSKK